MSRLADKSRKVITSLARQAESFVNGIRFGFIFLRARWFKMPTKIKVAGKQISLHYPPEAGVPNDFFTCVIRNDYGLRHRLPEVRTILDIGANVGFFSIAARARYPRAIIHAYEPNPRVLPFLRTNASGLGIEVYPEAVGLSKRFSARYRRFWREQSGKNAGRGQRRDSIGELRRRRSAPWRFG